MSDKMLKMFFQLFFPLFSNSPHSFPSSLKCLVPCEKQHTDTNQRGKTWGKGSKIIQQSRKPYITQKSLSHVA